MADLNTIYELVKEILMIDERARDDDMYLFVQYCKRKKGMEILKKPFYEVMANAIKYGLPSYESVSRARRKVQSEYPELRPSEGVGIIREEYEQMYIDWARG